MRRGLLLGAVALALSACATAKAPSPSPSQDYLHGFAAAEREAKPFVPASEAIQGLSMDQAYALQRRVVAGRLTAGDRAAGYKGGLMSAKSLADRGVRQPLTGVLFRSGDAGADASLCGYRSGIFELKLGYVFNSPVRRRLASVAELRPLVGAVQPVIELPDIAYRNPDKYGALDMVAANITAARYVRGKSSPADGIDLDALKVSLERDGATLAQGSGRESLGGQWESLLTLVNLIVERGDRIEPGHFVLTGKIGDKGAATPGAYTADYGALGQVRFSISPCRK